MIRLGDGTDESNQKLQDAINEIWEFTGEFFEKDEVDEQMLKEGVGVDNSLLESQWNNLVNETFQLSKIKRPNNKDMRTGSKKGAHTNHLSILLEEMQYLPRTYPDAKW